MSAKESVVGADTPGDLDLTYRQRFSEHDVVAKDAVWKHICAHLQRYIDRQGSVLDVACDHGAFIRHITAGEKWATDIRDMTAVLTKDVHFAQGDGMTMADRLPNNHFDTVFMSNYLEHLPSAEAVTQQIRQARLVLKPGGRLIILQPNIRLTGGQYWDFLDHKTALTEKSLVEATELAGFTTEKLVTRFLPYSTKSNLPQAGWLVRAYLAFPPIWWLMGKQTLYVGSKPLLASD